MTEDKKPEQSPEKQQPKEITWKQFIGASKERAVCPILKNTCIGPKCRMWLSAPEGTQTVEGALTSECAHVVQALCLSALVAMNAELTGQLGDLLSSSADALEGDDEGESEGDSEESEPIPDLSGGEDE